MKRRAFLTLGAASAVLAAAGGQSGPDPRRASAPRTVGPGHGGTPPAGPASREPRPARVLCSRVDWLTVAFRVRVREDLVSEWLERLAAAGRVGMSRTPVKHAGRMFELRSTSNRNRYLMQNADVSAVLELGEQHGWTVSVDFTGMQMARTKLREAIRCARQIASGIGPIEAARVRRVDLCADVEGLNLSHLDGTAWVKPRRAKLEHVSPEAIAKTYDEHAVRTWQTSRGITGITVAPRNVLTLVCYDKREELAQKGREAKTALEEARWRAAGWDGNAAVARAEFRWRSYALGQFDRRPDGTSLRDRLDELEENLDRLWQFATTRWVRLVDRASAQRESRCRVDGRWRLLQEHVFAHNAVAATRDVTPLGGASSAMAFGALNSRLAAAGALAPTPMADERGDAVPETMEPALISRMPASVARIAARCELERQFVAAVPVLLADFERNKGSPNAALAFFRGRMRATSARFWSQAKEDPCPMASTA